MYIYRIYIYIYIFIFIYIYIYSYIHIYIATGRPYPTCRHKAIVVMRRMGALDCLHDVTIYVLCSLLCAC